ncbi:MAG: NAD-dependent epimerase/dehydratase family protein [Vicinamibacterales bacterium]
MADLVTGATGFTGGHLARMLVRRGHTVRALVRDRKNAADLEAQGIELIEGDLRDRAALARAVAGIDRVYHIAAMYRQAGLPADTYRAVNALAVHDLIEASARAGVTRVMHCSTVGVHGDVEHPPANEDAPLRPGDIYQETKVEGEALAREAARQFGIEVTIARPSGIYGPGDRRLLKMFKGVARGRFPMLGSGDIYYHLTFIDDLCEGFRLCAEAPGGAGRTYILAGGEVTTLNELVAIVADVAGVKPPTHHLPVWPFWVAGGRAKHSVRPSASSRRSIGVASISIPRAGRSTSAVRAPRLDTTRRSGCARGSVVRSTGTGSTAGSETWHEHDVERRHPEGAGATVQRAHQRATKYATLIVGRTGLGSAHRVRARRARGAVGAWRARPGTAQSALSDAPRIVRPQRGVRPERRAAPSAQNPHCRRRGDRRQLPRRRERRDRNRGIRIGNGVFIGRNTILSCKNGDIELADAVNIGFNCELFSASRVTNRHGDAAGGVHLRHRRRPRLLRSVEVDPRTGARLARCDDWRGRMDWRGREGARRRHDWRHGNHRRRRGRDEGRASSGSGRRRAGEGRLHPVEFLQ